MTTKNFRRKMAFAICPELEEEISSLEHCVKFDELEIDSLKQVIEFQKTLINDYIEFMNQDQDDEKFNEFLTKSVGESTKEEIEKTLSDPNGKLVFK